MKYILLVFSILISVVTMAQTAPPACSCRYAGKDYDPAKGYYFDRKGYNPMPTISYRMECLYVCADKNEKLWQVSYVHEETRYGHKVGGVTHAKHFICDLAVRKFIPNYDMPDHISNYDVELVGDFSSQEMNHRATFKEWNEKNCR